MGLGDIVGKVLTVYKADTSDHKAKLKELTGEEKKHAEATVKAREQVNKSIDSSILKLGAYGAAAAASFALAKTGFEEFAKSSQLSAATASFNLEKLSKAAGGLRTQIQLQELAVAGSTGTWKLSQTQLEKVLQGWQALRIQGKDSEAAYKALGEAIKKGTVEPLKEAGIAFDATMAKTDQQAAFFGALGDAATQTGGKVSLVTDEMTRMGIQTADAMSKIKIAIGQIVMALEPAISLLGRTAAFYTPASDSSKFEQIFANEDPAKFFKALSISSGGKSADLEKRYYEWQAQYIANHRAAVNARKGTYSFGIGSSILGLPSKALAGSDYYSVLGATLNGLPAGAGRPGEGDPNAYRLQSAEFVDLLALAKSAANSGSDGDFWTRGILNNDARIANSRSGAATSFSIPGLDTTAGRANQAFSSTRESFLESKFGPVSEFDVYKTAFEGLTTAVTSSFDAWISGSKSVGEAMKEAVAGFAKGLAHEALLQALRHTAFAIGSLAIGGPLAGASASAHFKAAAVWGGVAAAAGIAARGLGGSSAGPSAGASGYRAGSNAGGNAGSNTVIIIGDVASDNSPRRQARETRRLQELSTKYAPPTRGSS